MWAVTGINMKYPGVVQCLKCKSILISNHRHDFRLCGCSQQTFIDGGYDYMRYGGLNLDLVVPLKLSRRSKLSMVTPRKRK